MRCIFDEAKDNEKYCHYLKRDKNSPSKVFLEKWQLVFVPKELHFTKWANTQSPKGSPDMSYIAKKSLVHMYVLLKPESQ